MVRPADEPADAELVAAHRAGDRHAAGLLVVRHTGLVRKAVKLCGRLPSFVEVDDLIQAGWMAIVRCTEAGRWSPDGGSKFSTYAFTAILNAVRREIRDQTRGAAGVELGADAEPDAPEPAPPPDVDRLLAGCEPLGRRILAGLFGLTGNPEPAGELARRVGVTTHQLRRLRDAALAAARKKADAA